MRNVVARLAALVPSGGRGKKMVGGGRACRHSHRIDRAYPAASALARSTRLLVLIGLLTVAGCDADLFGGPPIPSDSSEVQVDLSPSGSQTFTFAVEAEMLPDSQFSGSTIYVTIHPHPESLLHQGIRTEHSWVDDQLEDPGWGNEILSIGEVLAGQPLQDLLRITLTNDSDAQFITTLTLIITPNGGVPVPDEDDMRVSIHEADPPSAQSP